MQVDLQTILKPNSKIAVAVSGGCDSMCLLHFLYNNAVKFNISVIAINVEHGIRGESSISDSQFVKDYCQKNNIKLLSYSVDALNYASQNKLSVEQAARLLRYECFENALKRGECDKVATAHHRDDNVETVLFNIFRGTGLKGLAGIEKERKDCIIRPFLSLDRIEIEEYAKSNNIPFVTDQTNLSDDYTRNNIRHNIIPKIKKIFPELSKSVERLSVIAQSDDEYITSVAESLVKLDNGVASIPLPCHKSLLSRATIVALKAMGIKKDWEKAHIDGVIELATLSNGSRLSLLKGITAIKEYDKIVFYKEKEKQFEQINFSVGETTFLDKKLIVKKENSFDLNLKSRLFADLDKIPQTAVIRTRRTGDIFTKFGGGTKLLNDYLTDKKIPLRTRDELVLIADGNIILAIFGLAISDKIKVDGQSKRIISLTQTAL